MNLFKYFYRNKCIMIFKKTYKVLIIVSIEYIVIIVMNSVLNDFIKVILNQELIRIIFIKKREILQIQTK